MLRERGNFVLAGLLFTLVDLYCLLPGPFWNVSPVESWEMARTKYNIKMREWKNERED